MTLFRADLGEAEAATPVYHRLASCGPARGGAVHRATHLRCDADGLPDDQRARNAQRILTCYLERLIYDDMFRTQSLHFPATLVQAAADPAQDEGHRHWLDVTRSDYRSCFPSEDLGVDLVYHGQFPVSLTVRGVGDDGRELWRDVYVRQLVYEPENVPRYDALVTCSRRTEGGTRLVRAQNFETGPTAWAAIGASTAGGSRRPQRRRTTRSTRSKSCQGRRSWRAAP